VSVRAIRFGEHPSLRESVVRQLLERAVPHASIAGVTQLEQDVTRSMDEFRRRRGDPRQHRAHLKDLKRRRHELRKFVQACANFRGVLSDAPLDIRSFGVELGVGRVSDELKQIEQRAGECAAAPPPGPRADVERLQLIWDLAVTLNTAGITVNASRSGTLHRLLELAEPPRTRRRERGRNGQLKPLEPATPPDFVKSINPIIDVLQRELSWPEAYKMRLRPSWFAGPAVYSSVLQRPPLIIQVEYGYVPATTGEIDARA
jgi:hypothetical protein